MAEITNGGRRGCYWCTVDWLLLGENKLQHERTTIRRNLIAMSNAIARCNENVKKNDRWKSL